MSASTQANTPADYVILMKIIGTEYSFHTYANKRKTKTALQEITDTYSMCFSWGA